MTTASSAALETEVLTKRFGGLLATNAVSLSLDAGARHALIGPNGAGKTTLVNLLTGVLRPTSGAIRLGGEDITDLPVHERVRRGLARTFQVNQLFPALTPVETVALAVAERRRLGRDPWRPAGRGGVAEEAAEILERFGLADVMTRQTHVLPYGRQRLLEIATAFASRPRVLLLDEPAAGVPEDERHAILDILAELPREVTIMLIEHDMDLVFRFAERITVLVDGGLFLSGTPAEIAADPRVRAVYLGEGEEAA